MTRGHRRVHGVIWIVLAPALVVLLVFVLRGRGTTPVVAPASARDRP